MEAKDYACYSRGMEWSMEDFQATLERTKMDAKRDEATTASWAEKGRSVCGIVLREATTALERAEAREADEIRVRIMESS